jgi:hypothetical protein
MWSEYGWWFTTLGSRPDEKVEAIEALHEERGSSLHRACGTFRLAQAMTLGVNVSEAVWDEAARYLSVCAGALSSQRMESI